MTGTIKKLMTDKHCGFIVGEDRNEYFFHESALKNASYVELEVGRELIFEDVDGPRGLRAEDVYLQAV